MEWVFALVTYSLEGSYTHDSETYKTTSITNDDEIPISSNKKADEIYNKKHTHTNLLKDSTSKNSGKEKKGRKEKFKDNCLQHNPTQGHPRQGHSPHSSQNVDTHKKKGENRVIHLTGH